jgi:hypothetical protein
LESDMPTLDFTKVVINKCSRIAGLFSIFKKRDSSSWKFSIDLCDVWVILSTASHVIWWFLCWLTMSPHCHPCHYAHPADNFIL